MEFTSPSFDSYQQHFQSTPAFHFNHPHYSHASSSSSPATEVLVTPRDAQKIMMGKDQDARQGVRVRTNSAGQSSPFTSTPSSLDYRQLLPAPSFGNPVSRAGTLHRTAPASNRLPPNRDPTQIQAQLQGYTPDQFEQAKLDLVRLLRTGPIPNTHDSNGKGKGRSTALSRGVSYDSSIASGGNGSDKSIRSRPSLEEIVERSGSRRQQVEEEQESMHWTGYEQEMRMESDYEDSRTMEVNVIEEQAYRSRITPRSYPTPYQNRISHIPNSTYALTSPAMQHQQIPRQPLSAHRGMMERFMDDRDPVLQSFESPPLSTMELAPVYGQHHPRTRHFSPAPTVLRSNEGVQHSSIFNHAPTSPRPSRPPQADLLCSPDVARLLRSELDELAATKSNKKGSIQADNDILVEEPFSSPYESHLTYEDSGFLNQNSKRSRELQEMSLESAKRNRYENQARGVSPCPSLQAPSFCDSSPAGSDIAISLAPSSISAGQTHYGHSIPVHSSNTDYTYRAPSSSPASSQASSDYAPPVHDITSPEPIVALRSDLQIDSAPPAPKRKSSKRADSSPSGDVAKPSWSYAALIGQAVFSTDSHKISLADIYSHIMAAYPYYRKEDSGWQNSIRHNLSLNECFIKTARGLDNPGKGCLWAVAAGCEEQFADGGFVKKGGGPSSRRPKSKKTDSLAKVKRSSLSPPPSRADSPAYIAVALPVAVALRRFSPIPEPSPPTPPIPVYHTMPLPTIPQSYARPQSATSNSSQSSAGIGMIRRPSTASPAPAVASKVEETKRLAPAYELRPLPAFTSGQSIFNHNAPASPPTSVYNRLALPYEPSGYSLSSAQSHRALALLASPEQVGIMPVHPSIYDVRPNSSTTTTPPLSIFPSSSRNRQRTTDYSVPSSTLSNTHSPISSLRSNSEEKPYSIEPEKQRFSYNSPKRSRSHIPSVAALALESISTPPRLLRSPTFPSSIGTIGGGGGHGRNRSIGNMGGLFGTPGGRGRWSDPFGGDGGIEELGDFVSKAWNEGAW